MPGRGCDDCAMAETWRDPKRWLWLLSTLMPWLVALNLWRFAGTGELVWLWLLPLWIHIVVPAFDALLGEDRSNPPASAVTALEADRWYRALVAAYVPGQWLVTVLAAWIAARAELSPAAWAGLVLSAGGINGVGINAAHELGHKRVRWEQWLSRLALAPVAYGHFQVEHNRGHHARVATPADPASARLGESFWAFLPRTVFGSLRSAWRLEAMRLAYEGGRAWSVRNQNLQAWSLTALLFAGLAATYGPGVLPFLIVQALYGISLLEVVNYIEHYGLERKKLRDGRYEPVSFMHSWNSDALLTNLFLFHLQRHADHHRYARRPYQILRSIPDAPQLPTGYAGMILVALVPPLWFRIMNPRVAALRDTGTENR